MDKVKVGCGTLVLIFLCAFCLVGTTLISERANVEEVTGIVIDKYIKRYNDADIFHIAIETSNGEVLVLQNTDAITWGKFNSADVQQEIEIGETYQFTVVGWRIPILSSFQNIVEYQHVGER